MSGTFARTVAVAARVCGATTAAIGAYVMACWRLHAIAPEPTPMPHNAALAAFLCGAALVVAHRLPRSAVGAGAATFLLALATLLQMLLGYDLRIDDLFVAHGFVVRGPAPGRMAPNTAIAFILAGAAVALLGWRRGPQRRPAVEGLLGSAVAGIGAAAAIGYLAGIPHGYLWSGVSPMAPVTAAAVCALGAGIVARALEASASEDGGVPGWAAWAAALPVAVTSAALWRAAALSHDAAGRLADTAVVMGILAAALLGLAIRFALKAGTQSQEAERSRRELDAFFTLSLDLLCIATPDGRFKRLNPAWAATLGYREADLLSRPNLDFVHPDDRDSTLEAARTQVEGNSIGGFENWYRAADGSWHWLKCTSAPSADRRTLYACTRDITCERQRTAELAEREERFRRLFEDSPIGITLAGPDFRYAQVNAAFAEMFGYSEGELRSMSFRDLSHPDDRERSEGLVERLAAGTLPRYRIEKRYVRKDGRILWADVTVTAIRDAAGRPIVYVGLYLDVTDRNRRDEEIRNLNAALEQRIAELSAVNSELEAFTYSVSHDLRAPLRHIDGFSKMLLEDADPAIEAVSRRRLERIRNGARQMGRMIDELLELSRMSRRELERTETDLDALVRELAAELTAEGGDREIEWRIGRLPEAYCDPFLVRQALTNLLANAVKFTAGRRRARIEVGQAEAGGEPAIFVRDNGVGFNMKYADKLFGPFQRLHRQEEFDGTGIGLALTARIVRRHGGRVWAEAVEGQGATFYLTLGAGGLSDGIRAATPENEYVISGRHRDSAR